MIDLKHQLERELDRFDPPDLWDRIQVEAADDGAPLVEPETTVHPSGARRWLAAAAAVTALVLIGGALARLGGDGAVETVPADSGVTGAAATTNAADPAWSGPVREPSDVVRPMDVPRPGERSWTDPVDAADGRVDVTRLRLTDANAGLWAFDLATRAPIDIEPGLVLSYGLVFDTDADGAADHVAGIERDDRRPGGFRAWTTDLETGKTEEQTEPPYGYPIEFVYPSDQDPTSGVVLTFLPDSAPPGLDPDEVRFYAWTSATRDGAVVAHDVAPETGWITGDQP